MNKDAIKNILPHRDPMLLIEEAELIDGIAMASYTVRGDEYFLQGHFPQKPVVPGVILCEMMAQSACLLIDADGPFLPYFTGMNNVKFKDKVFPGDHITFKTTLTKSKPPFYFVKSEAYVVEKLCASGELSFAVIKEDRSKEE